MAQMMYRDALRAALQEEMRRDPRVFVIGEEVGRYGGAYAVTKGLFEEFGAERLVDAPISEASTVGLGVGAAITGLAPGGGADVRGLRGPGDGSDRQPDGQGPLHDRRPGHRAHGAAYPGRHGPFRRCPALAEPGVLAGACSRPAGRDARHAGRCEGPPEDRRAQRRSGGVHRAQGAVRDERRRSRRRTPCTLRRRTRREARAET